MLRPGTQVIKAHGDLHDFTRWQGPILTDSGDFRSSASVPCAKSQSRGAFPLTHRRQPYLHGDRESMLVQRDLGSDIVMIFDECTPHPVTEAAAGSRWSSPCAGPNAARWRTAIMLRHCSALGGVFEALRAVARRVEID